MPGTQLARRRRIALVPSTAGQSSRHLSWPHVLLLRALDTMPAPSAEGWALLARIYRRHAEAAEGIYGASLGQGKEPVFSPEQWQVRLDAAHDEAETEYRAMQDVIFPRQGAVKCLPADRALELALATWRDSHLDPRPEMVAAATSVPEAPATPTAPLVRSFDGHPITVVEYQGRQIFFVDELATALGYEETRTLRDSIRRKWGTEMEEGEEYLVVTNGDIRSLENLRRVRAPDGRSHSDKPEAPAEGGARKLVVLTEAGVNLVCIKTEKPAGKQLRRWLAREVLPSIRRTGGYQVEPAPAGPAPTALAPATPEELAEVREELRALRGLVEGLRGQASSPRLPAAAQPPRTPSHPLRSRPQVLWPSFAPEQLARFFARWAAEIGCRRPLRSAELVDLAEECELLSTEGCSALTSTMRVGRILGGVLRADQPVAGFRLHRHHHGVRGNVFWLEAEQLALP